MDDGFLDRVRSAASGLEKSAIASRVECSTESVRRWMNGSTTPPARFILVLSDMANVSLDWLMRGQELKSNGVHCLKSATREELLRELQERS